MKRADKIAKALDEIEKRHADEPKGKWNFDGWEYYSSEAIEDRETMIVDMRWLLNRLARAERASR